jgi:hypothetical protein
MFGDKTLGGVGVLIFRMPSPSQMYLPIKMSENDEKKNNGRRKVLTLLKWHLLLLTSSTLFMKFTCSTT